MIKRSDNNSTTASPLNNFKNNLGMYNLANHSGGKYTASQNNELLT